MENPARGVNTIEVYKVRRSFYKYDSYFFFLFRRTKYWTPGKECTRHATETS